MGFGSLTPADVRTLCLAECSQFSRLNVERDVGNRLQHGIISNYPLQKQHRCPRCGQNKITQENAEAPSSFALGRFRLCGLTTVGVSREIRTQPPPAIMRDNSVWSTRRRSKVSSVSPSQGSVRHVSGARMAQETSLGKNVTPDSSVLHH